MISYKHFIAVMASTALLTGCMGGASSNGGVTTAAKQTSLMGLVENAEMSVDTGAAFKGVNEVVIGGFIVGFDTEKTDSVKAGGGLLGSGFGGKSTARSKLEGISNATMQKITDAAYADFVGKLKAAGIKVADRSALLANKSFADSKTYDNPMEDTQGGMLGGGNTSRYFSPSSFGKTRVFLGDITGFTGGIGFSSPVAGAAEFAEKNGTKVIHVAYHVDYANADKYGGWSTNSSAISVGQGITITPNNSRVGIIGGQMGTFSSNVGSITLGQPISSDKEFAKVEDATSDTAKTVEVVTNVIGVLGGIGSNSSRTYTFQADPAKFSAGTGDALKKANEAFISKIGSLK